MNILHHKSWHVYNKDNIARVKRDEAEAEAEAKKKRDRVQLAESEARLQLLRSRAEGRLPANEENQLWQNTQTERFNLFEDLEKQNSQAKNEENEAEQKEKDEKWERKITMYLDKGASKEDEPWYAKKDREDEKYVDHHVFKSKRPKDDKYKKRKLKSVNDDPLDFINKSLKKREEREKKRDKHHHHRSKSKSSSKKSKESSSSSPSIEELRARRLERERSEQARVKSIFMDNSNDKNDVELDDRKRGYNSQYNRSETMQAKEHIKKRIRFSE